MARLASDPGSDPTAQLVGQSPAMYALRLQLRHLATFDTLGNAAAPTVLLHGETGTGKGLVAQVLHASGPRARGPFVAVNCAAIPETLLEAELFGFEAGAFSEAKRAKPGLFETASGGSLFLDEIDTLPRVLQSKLLMVLEAKRVRRLGAVAERVVDVKLIAATQAELSAQVAQGQFRADLYHRLAVVVLELTPLRARPEDSLELARTFLQRYATAHGLHPKQLSPTAEDWLRRYDWPGNVRELSHLMERVTLLSSDLTLTSTTLERLVLPRVESTAQLGPGSLPPAREPLDEAERIRQALQASGGNVVQAARQLGLSRSGLRYRLQRYGLESPRPRGPRHAASPQTVSPPVARAQDDAPNGARPGPAAGWKETLVALLAIDLTFSPRTGVEAADEEPWTQNSRWEEMLVQKVQGFGGLLVQHMVSLFLVAFGLAQEVEQLPQRAVQAALAIRQAVAAAQGQMGQAPVPEVRQTIHLGPLLVEETGGEPPVRCLAVGETTSIPIRLLGHTAAGEILVSPQVGRRLGGWCTLQARATAVAAGHPIPEEAYRVLGLVTRRSPLVDLERRLRNRFVGRERELTTLHALLEQVTAGHGQVVHLVGEPGVGKSRLLYEFHQSLRGQSVTYLEGRCLSYGSTLPYGPVLDLLRDNCGITETDSPEVVTAKVRVSLQEVGLDPDEDTMYLLHLLGIPTGTEALASLRPETVKARTFATLVQMSLRSSQQQPLLLVIEDLQWIDPTSADFLTVLVEQLAGVPIFLLTTARPSAPAPWLRKSYATQLALAPLAPQESRRLIHATFHTELVPAALMQLLLSKAEGNPLFLEELVQGLVEQGVCVHTAEGGITLAASWRTRPMTAVPLPATVQGVLAARIDCLAPAARELLQTLAVIGPTCSWRLLRQVVEAPTDVLRQRLMALQGAELLYERPAVPEPEYTFKHVLTQEVAYRSLPPAQRGALHEHTAQTLEALFPTRLEEHYSALAYHYAHSSNAAKAVDFLQRAGRQAVQRSAYDEAIRHLTTALEVLPALPDMSERLQQELAVQATLGVALMTLKGYADPDVVRAYTRARALCQCVEDTPQLFPVLWGLWAFYFVRGELQIGHELAEQLLDLAYRTHDPALRLEAHLALGVNLQHLGDAVVARTHVEQALVLFDPKQHRVHAVLYGHDPQVACLADLACILWVLGYPDQARQRSHEALTMAQTVDHVYSRALVHFFAAWSAQLRRHPQDTLAQAAAVLTLAQEHAFSYLEAMGRVFQGWAVALQGQVAEGMAQMHQGLAAYQAIVGGVALPHFLGMLAEMCGQAGQTAEGLACLTEALAIVHRTGDCWWEAELYRLKGELLLSRSAGDYAEADTCLRCALDIAGRQQAKSLELRAAMSLARLWQRQDKRADAYELLAPIYGWFTEGFDTADLQEAKALLEELA